jgi:hypothetical protein
VPRIAAGARWLIAVGAGFFAAQLLLFSVHRGPSWDEAVYLSQVTPGAHAVFFAPSRARGITLLVAPVAGLGGSIAAVRVFLAAASSVALVASFLPWVTVLGAAAALAAFLLGFSWLGLFYGTEVMPNLWAALAGVAAVGVMAPVLAGNPRRRRWRAVAAAALLFAVALFRPPDSVPVAVALVAGLVVTRRASVRVLGVLAAGLVLGWAPWLVETSVRLGSLSAAFAHGGSAAHVALGDVPDRALQHLSLSDGPTLGPDHGVPVAGVLWWTGLVALTAWALVRARRTPPFPALATAAVAGAGVLAEYLVFVAGLAPRFLLPAYAFLGVTAAAGVRSLVLPGRTRRVAGALAVVMVAAWAGWHVWTADRIEQRTAVARASVWKVGLALQRLVGGNGCAFASSDGYPQVQLASGCEVRQLRGDPAAAAAALERAAAPGEPVFLVQRSPGASLPSGWVSVASIARPDGSWWVVSELHAPSA